MRYTFYLTCLSCLLASFSFSQTKKTPSETVIVNGKKYSVVTKVETDKSKVKMLSPTNSKKAVLSKNKAKAIDPKKK